MMISYKVNITNRPTTEMSNYKLTYSNMLKVAEYIKLLSTVANANITIYP